MGRTQLLNTVAIGTSTHVTKCWKQKSSLTTICRDVVFVRNIELKVKNIYSFEPKQFQDSTKMWIANNDLVISRARLTP